PSGVTPAPSPEPPASDLSFRDLTSLLDSPIDVLIVELDAATPEGYRRLKGVDAFERVTAAMQQLLAMRSQRAGPSSAPPPCDASPLPRATEPGAPDARINSEFRIPHSEFPQPGPLLVAELVKCPATLAEMEEFFDRWRFADESNLAGLHDYAGQFHSPAGPGWPTCPPRRRPCVRVARRLTILSDGTVPQCDIDFAATAPLGSINEQTLDEIWSSVATQQLQADHRDLKLGNRPLCQRCDQWNRP
ncbi:MAG: SPASM domain-containing protein, partial [Phycisphaerae bacterium]|nr:SPASM domain-containing protein [Phycisphaerae bacterium]